jgi:hypothetical protein
MSMTAMVQDWMLSLGDREHAAVRSRAHIAAETSQDLDAICSSIAADPFFVVPTRTGAGYKIDSSNVLTTEDLVRDYYGGRMGGYVIVASRQLKSFASDWYVFNDTVASLRGTGMVGSVDATDQRYAVQAAVLFPAAPDGIRGEIAVGRYAYDDSIRGESTIAARSTPYRVPDDLGTSELIPLDELENAVNLDVMVEALRDGNALEFAGLFSADHCTAVRVDDIDGKSTIYQVSNKHESKDAFASMFAGAQDVALMVKVNTVWYSFAEYLVRLDGGRIRRIALIHGVQDGRLIGTFGYGRDESTGDGS